jgi:hypothetical protein
MIDNDAGAPLARSMQMAGLQGVLHGMKGMAGA